MLDTFLNSYFKGFAFFIHILMRHFVILLYIIGKCYLVSSGMN